MLSRRREKVLGRLTNRRFRAREGLVLVEGIRAVEEALGAGAEVEFAVVSSSLGDTSRGAALRSRLSDIGAAPDEVEDADLHRYSDTEAPQGVLLVCREPRWNVADVLSARPGRFLVLDAVQDPGNAGTLVRSAWAFGSTGVLALDGTVDPWNPKVVRSAAGATFRLPVSKIAWDEVERMLGEREIQMLVADASGEDVSRVRPGPSWALVIGNEGAGARPEIMAAAASSIRIPMPGGAESLNAGVAGSILLHALTRPEGRGD